MKNFSNLEKVKTMKVKIIKKILSRNTEYASIQVL
jgi:hypothetical protein